MNQTRPGGGKILGVLGGMGPLASAQFMLRLTLLTPAERDQDHMARLASAAIAAVKANRVADAYLPLAEVVASLRDRGAQAVVLGCTEIPLGIQAGPWETIGVPVVDTIDALARAAINWANT